MFYEIDQGDDMQFIGIRDFRSKSASILKKLGREKEMVITSNGRPVAVLSAVNEGDLERSLKILRRARAMAAFELMQKKAAASSLNKMSLPDINEEIHKARRSRG